MIRFVDLTKSYWTDEDNAAPCCAFLNTSTDCFISFEGTHVIDSDEQIDDVNDDNIAMRCRKLVPDGFWNKPPEQIASFTEEDRQRLLEKMSDKW